MGVLNVNPILDVWCALCDHLAPFAAMAVVPLLLWVHHFETMPPAAIHESGSTDSRNSGVLVGDVATGEVIDLPSDSGKVVATTDAPEGWAA